MCGKKLKLTQCSCDLFSARRKNETIGRNWLPPNVVSVLSKISYTDTERSRSAEYQRRNVKHQNRNKQQYKIKNMTKKLVITLSILTLFTSCETRSNANTFDEGVVINGIRWATRNVDRPGTFTENPEDSGMHFLWNSRRGWNANNYSERRVRKRVDGRVTRGNSWAHRNDPCPRGWRVPTLEEMQLLQNANSEWATINGVNGRLFGTAPNQVFLPAAGLLTWGGVDEKDSEGIYWSSTPARHRLDAEALIFNSISSELGDFPHWWILSVRCVSIQPPPPCTQRVEISASLDGVVINGIRWATRNVDAPGTFAETPESSGMLFQWNRKKAWNAVDAEVENWDCSIPEGTKWYAENDPCPEGWRVPTIEELAILENINSIWITQNGVNGRLFGIAPYQLFLPATGWRIDRRSFGRNDTTLPVNGELVNAGEFGAYWSSSNAQWHYCNTRAGHLILNRGLSITANMSRAGGFSIRCVAK